MVREAYATRSKYAHVGTPKKEPDLPRLRAVVNRCLLTRIVIGDPVGGRPLQEVADRALLCQEVLEDAIRQAYREFAERVAAQ